MQFQICFKLLICHSKTLKTRHRYLISIMSLLIILLEWGLPFWTRTGMQANLFAKHLTIGLKTKCLIKTRGHLNRSVSNDQSKTRTAHTPDPNTQTWPHISKITTQKKHLPSENTQTYLLMTALADSDKLSSFTLTKLSPLTRRMLFQKEIANNKEVTPCRLKW